MKWIVIYIGKHILKRNNYNGLVIYINKIEGTKILRKALELNLKERDL
jgi:hypothetical protein